MNLFVISVLSTAGVLLFLITVTPLDQTTAMAQNATQFQCAICGDEAEVTNPDGVVVIPPLIDGTCAELMVQAELGNITEEQCREIILEAQEPCACLYFCPLCEAGKVITTPAGIVSIPSRANITCRELEEASADGNITWEECLDLQPFLTEPCGCMEELQGPSGPPAGAPTFGTSLPCWTDLDELAAQMDATALERDPSIPLDIILCPNTVFTFGVREYENFTYTGGFAPISPKTNTHWKCGDDGALTNNCIFKDGEIAVNYIDLDGPTDNVTFQGIIFESQITATFLGGSPGDITFKDCLLRNQTSASPVLSVFIPVDRRRHLERSPNVMAYINHLATKVPPLQGLVDWTAEEYNDTNGVRELQEGNPNNLNILTVSFNNTIFEDCFSQPDTDFVEPAIVTAYLGYTIFNFDNVAFRNNDYGNPNYHPITAAIMTDGPSLSITNSCFEGNQFLERATVLAVGFEDFVTSNTYGTFTETLVCQFLGCFPNSTDVVSLENYTCTEYDSKVCTAQLPNVSVPQPTVAPVQQTLLPMNTPSLPPAEGETDGPPSMESESSASTMWERMCVLFLLIVSSLLAFGNSMP